MNLPKLTAEQSLVATQGVYINKVASLGSDQFAVTTMMEQQPNEILFHQLSFLDIPALLRFGQTSKANLDLVQSFLSSPVGKDWVKRNDRGTCYLDTGNTNCNPGGPSFQRSLNISAKLCCEGNPEDIFQIPGASWRSNHFGNMCFPCNQPS